jgi:hypothetical protein
MSGRYVVHRRTQPLTQLNALSAGKEAHEKQRRVLSPALKYSRLYIIPAIPQQLNTFV